MDITSEKTDSGVLLTLKGNATIEHAMALHELLQGNVEHNLFMDLSGVERLDTSIIQLIMAARRGSAKRGKEFHVVRPPSVLIHVFYEAGLEGGVAF